MTIAITEVGLCGPLIKVLKLDNAKHGENFTLPAKHRVLDIAVRHNSDDLVSQSFSFDEAGAFIFPAKNIVGGVFSPSSQRWRATSTVCTISTGDVPPQDDEFTAWITLLDMSSSDV